MQTIAEKLLMAYLSGKSRRRLSIPGLLLPLFLAVGATLIKHYCFVSTGHAIPFLFYFFVVLFSGCYGGSLSALIAVAAICISGAIWLTGIPGRPYMLLEWLLFIAEGLFIAALFYLIETVFAQLLLKEARFQRIIDQSAEGFLLCNKVGDIIYCCPSVNRLLDRQAERCRLADLVVAEDRKYFNQAVAKLLQNGGSVILKVRLQHRNGRQIWTECCLNNLLSDPIVKSVIIQIWDVSHNMDREKQREDFIHMASHELKTPVTAIRGFLQLSTRRLKEGKIDGFQQYLDRMSVQTDKILSLVEEMLNTTPARTGKLQYHSELFDLSHSIREIAAAVQAGNPTHHIDLRLPLDPVIIKADEARIGQVVTNLLTNAIKYSPGRELVQLTLQRDHDYLKIIVRDDGIGIPSDKIKRVFDRFYRVAPKGPFAGFGLGLFIAAEIVHHHHGEIGVDSEDGKGSAFWFTLPDKVAQAAD